MKESRDPRLVLSLLLFFLWHQVTYAEIEIKDPYINNADFIAFINPLLAESQNHVDFLYDLDDILESAAFKQAKTNSQRETILKDGFLKKRDQVLKEIAANRARLKNTFRVLGLAALATAAFLRPDWFFELGAKMGGVNTMAAGVGIFYTGIDMGWSLYTEIMARYRLERHGLMGVTVPMQATQELFASKYWALKKHPELLRASREKMILMGRDTIEAMMIYDGFIRVASRVPAAAKGTNLNNEVFNDFFKFFPQDIKDQMDQLAQNHVLLHHLDATPKVNFPFYFQGVHGSGKTYAAKGLAKATGVPLGTVILEGATITEVIGSAPTRTSPGDPGRLLTALITTLADPETGEVYDDGILFIDEFDRLLNSKDPEARAVLSFMLKVLDPSNRSFKSPYLNATIKLPKTVILAGNHEIKDEALANRFRIVKFNGFPKDLKLAITRESIVPEMCSAYSISLLDLTAEDWKNIEGIVEKNSNEAGLRSIEKEILVYVSKLAFAKFNADLHRAALQPLTSR